MSVVDGGVRLDNKEFHTLPVSLTVEYYEAKTPEEREKAKSKYKEARPKIKEEFGDGFVLDLDILFDLVEIAVELGAAVLEACCDSSS